jgi:voltage-gated potassium channel
MSYSSLGATAIFNFLRNEDTLMLAEGLNVFRMRAPRKVVGKNLAQSKIRAMTECSVVAIKVNGIMSVNPDPQAPIPENAELVMIGSYEGEEKFLLWSKE